MQSISKIETQLEIVEGKDLRKMLTLVRNNNFLENGQEREELIYDVRPKEPSIWVRAEAGYDEVLRYLSAAPW